MVKQIANLWIWRNVVSRRCLTMSHVKTPRNRLRPIRRKQFHSATQSFNHLSHSLRPFDHLRLGRAFPKFSYQEMDEHWKGDSSTRLAWDVQFGKGVEQNGGDGPRSACSHPNFKDFKGAEQQNPIQSQSKKVVCDAKFILSIFLFSGFRYGLRDPRVLLRRCCSMWQRWQLYPWRRMSWLFGGKWKEL